MRKNAKVIEIRGLIMAVFIAVCLGAGFIAFPGYVAMHIWNYFSAVPKINLLQGIMLWAIVVLICFIVNKQQFAVSFGAPKELSEEEMAMLMQKIKLQSQAKIINKMMMQELKNKEEEQKEENVNKE